MIKEVPLRSKEVSSLEYVTIITSKPQRQANIIALLKARSQLYELDDVED